VTTSHLPLVSGRSPRIRSGRRPRPGLRLLSAVLVSAIVAAGCSGDETTVGADASPTVASTDVAVATTSGATSSTSPATTLAAVPTTVEPTTTEAPETTSAPTTVAPTTTVPAVVETRQVGTSVEGRPITAVRRGTPGGRVVLVIGVIHGDEAAGLAIVDLLEQYDVPDNVDLWLIDSMNPDGVANNDRHNANQVDLNRNFPADWGPIGVPGDGQYAGPSPASEPETQAMVAFISEIQPDLVMWYHQDLYRISPGKGRDGAIRARYAELVGLPVVSITGGTYTGVAATWAKRTITPGVAFIVELGASLTPEEADVHARAVLTVASEDN
jgi:murein peptide amidase A